MSYGAMRDRSMTTRVRSSALIAVYLLTGPDRTGLSDTLIDEPVSESSTMILAGSSVVNTFGTSALVSRSSTKRTSSELLSTWISVSSAAWTTLAARNSPSRNVSALLLLLIIRLPFVLLPFITHEDMLIFLISLPIFISYLPSLLIALSSPATL